MTILLDYLDGPDVITRFLMKRLARGSESERENVMKETEIRVMRGHKPRVCSSLWKLKKARKWILP